MAGEGNDVAAYAAAADAGGGLLTSAFNVHETRQNRRFQRDMSNTAHQREVNDLRAAGLNPILSATGGHGAQTPNTSAAQIEKPDFGGSVAKVNTSALVASQVKNVEADTSLKAVQAGDVLFNQRERLDLLIAQKEQAISSGALNQQMAAKASQEINNLRAQKKLLDLQVPEASAKAGYYRGVGKYLPEAKGLLHSAGQAAHATGKVWDEFKGWVDKNWKSKKKPARNGASGGW